MAKQFGEAQGENSLLRVRDNFRHYISGAQLSIISRYHALKTNISLKGGFSLDCWSRGLFIMVKKNAGVTLKEKLQAILLMEADSNALYKKVFGNSMLNVVISHGSMPEKIYIEQGNTNNDCSLEKVIPYDIVW